MRIALTLSQPFLTTHGRPPSPAVIVFLGEEASLQSTCLDLVLQACGRLGIVLQDTVALSHHTRLRVGFGSEWLVPGPCDFRPRTWFRPLGRWLGLGANPDDTINLTVETGLHVKFVLYGVGGIVHSWQFLSVAGPHWPFASLVLDILSQAGISRAEQRVAAVYYRDTNNRPVQISQSLWHLRAFEIAQVCPEPCLLHICLPFLEDITQEHVNCGVSRRRTRIPEEHLPRKRGKENAPPW